jgi:hypothetical protein
LPAYKTNPVTGKKYLSFSLGSILEANTRIGNALRGISEGVIMPDGSYVDLEQLHGAFKDAFALAGLDQYLDQMSPDIVAEMDKNIDWKDVVERLTEKKGGFGNHPILSYVDKKFPYITGSMVSLIGTDQYRYNPKVAMLYDLGVDPESFRFHGKTLHELSAEEHAQLINSGFYKIVRTHHYPRLLSKETGFSAGFNNGLEMPELQRRAKFLRDEALIQRQLAGMRLSYPRIEGPERLSLPQPEEELFTFSTLEMYEEESGEDVQIHMVRNRLERLASDSRNHAMQNKKFWMKAIEPDEDALLIDYPEGSEVFADAVKKMQTKIKALNKKLKEREGPLIPDPDEFLSDKAAVLRYKIKILFHARSHFVAGALQDIGHHFWFEDKGGYRIPEEDIRSWEDWRLDQAYDSGNLSVRHQTIYVAAPIIDRIIESLGYSDILGADIQKQQEAVKATRLHGIPSQNGNDRWYTLAQAEKDLNKLLDNELMEADVKALDHRYPGVWSTFLEKHHDAQASLGSYISYLKKQTEQSPKLTPIRQLRAGINPKTGKPIQAVDYGLSADNIIRLFLPERYLENPPRHPVTQKPVWLLSSTFNKKSLLHALRSGQELVIVGASTNKQYHLPKASLLNTPDRAGIWDDFTKAVISRYRESGESVPLPSKTLTFLGEGPYPVHNLRETNFFEQTLQIPKRHFEGILDHKLAGFTAPPTGIILRDDGLTLSNGLVRLLEKDPKSDKPTGWEVGANISCARKVSLAQISTLNDEQAQKYGYPTADEMVGSVAMMFTDHKLDPRDSKNKVWIVDFENIDAFSPERGTVFFDPKARKFSAINDDFSEFVSQYEAI